MIADIAASILLNKPLLVDSKRLDSLYDRTSNHFKTVEVSGKELIAVSKLFNQQNKS